MLEAPREPFRAPKGTRDILPPESARWTAFVAAFARLAERSGYGLLQSPLFEDYGVFQRIGESTDVVKKEMYDFEDKGGRHIALRPEGTAPVVRAWNQHHPTPPWKIWYLTPAFRYEAPQAGRLRQHHQVGIEVLGTPDPDVDVEVIWLLAEFYRELGLHQVDLAVNTMGTPEDRDRYVAVLRSWFASHLDALDPADRDNADRHPMRVLDSKRRATRAVCDDAPAIADYLSPESSAHFVRVCDGLDALGLAHRVEPRLVRGFDYYTHTTFEFQARALETAQNAVGGGGRYDGLAQALGGQPTPGIGFGCGIERVLLACDAEGVFPGPESSLDVFVVDVIGGAQARDLTVELRRAGLRADRAFDRRSMKSQMKQADRSGALVALIVGEDELAAGEVTVRPLRTGAGEQSRVARDDVVEHIRKVLS